MTEFKLQKGIKLPPAPHARLGMSRLKFPFKEMRRGESFFIARKNRNGGGSLIRYWNVDLAPKRFTLRTVTEKGVKGIRIWRVK